MDKIQKFVRKLNRDEAQRILDAIAQVRAGKLDEFAVKKLKGQKDSYWVRAGKVRILFTKSGGQNIITDVEFRSDHTY